MALEDLGFFQWYLKKELACEISVKDTESLNDLLKEDIQNNVVLLSSSDKNKIKELFADLIEADSNFELFIYEKDQKVKLTVSIPWGQNEKN